MSIFFIKLYKGRHIFNPIFISGSRFFWAQVVSVYVQLLEVALKLIVALNFLLLHHIYVYNFSSSINVRKYMHQTWLSLFILSINSLTLSGLPLTSFHLAEASLSVFLVALYYCVCSCPNISQNVFHSTHFAINLFYLHNMKT